MSVFTKHVTVLKYQTVFMSKCCFVTCLELTESCYQASSGLLNSTTVCSVKFLMKNRMHTTNIPYKVLEQTTFLFFFYQHANCSQKHLDLIRSHSRNIHNFSGLETKFPHCISLRSHTVDDIKHMADTSNCARQDWHISIHTEMKVTGGLTPIPLFYFLSCLVKKSGVSECFLSLLFLAVHLPGWSPSEIALHYNRLGHLELHTMNVVVISSVKGQ